MKALILIPLLVVGCIGAAALTLKSSGLRVNLMDPALAAGVAAVAAAVAIYPILRTRQKDPVSIIQRALLGTVLHILGTFVLAAALIFSHVESIRGPFVYWLLGSYWISLIILVWQLRLVILRLTSHLSNSLSDNLPNNIKVQN